MNDLKFTIVAVISLVSACTKHVAGVYCTTDADCTTPGLGFCDVDGQYPDSGFQTNTCSAKPTNCPVERCGCTTGAILSCTGSAATECGSDGMSSTIETCVLGCSPYGARCTTIVPSNGLGSAFADAMRQQDVTIASGAMIDTDTGDVTNADGTTTAVTSQAVTQTGGGPTIRAFEAQSFTIADVQVVGKNALALVASGPIIINGQINAAASGTANAPGAQILPAACLGSDSTSGSVCAATPGGGNATDGGGGGGVIPAALPGGGLVGSFVPLVGGCHGGNIVDGGVVSASGGGGGGAIQLVSGTSVSIGGLVSLGGGGGAPTCGGGAGGLLIVEAPTVTIAATGGVVANGGGGGCSVAGADAAATDEPAPSCGSGTAAGFGAGGTGSAAPVGGNTCGFPLSCTCDANQYTGGGGSVGRVHIVSADGTYTSDGSVMSALVITSTLTLQ